MKKRATKKRVRKQVSIRVDVGPRGEFIAYWRDEGGDHCSGSVPTTAPIFRAGTGRILYRLNSNGLYQCLKRGPTQIVVGPNYTWWQACMLPEEWSGQFMTRLFIP